MAGDRGRSERLMLILLLSTRSLKYLPSLPPESCKQGRNRAETTVPTGVYLPDRFRGGRFHNFLLRARSPRKLYT